MSGSPYVIRLQDVERVYLTGSESIAVLSAVSLAIRPGEMVAIVGASGSGKSTLMNMIGCLDRPTRGAVYINNIAVHEADTDRLAELRSQYLGFIFQRYHLIPYLTARENIAIPALYTAMPESQREQRIALLADKLGIGSRLHYKPSQLSGGQQQRVSIARALINGAQVILADEPTGALDSVSGAALMEVLHQLHNDGHTVIIVTHDRQIALQAQRIIEISDGRIVTDSPNPALRSPLPPPLPPVKDNGRASPGRAVCDAIRMARRALLGHRLRTFLSMLGIIIGISSVVWSMAVGEGARQTIMQEIGKLGSTTLEIRPGLGWSSRRTDMERALSLNDVASLSRLPWVLNVSPVVNTMVTVVRQSSEAPLRLSGVSRDFFVLQGIQTVAGRSFSLRDQLDGEPVLVLDETSRDALFSKGEDPIGELVQIAGAPWRVVGVARRPGPKMVGGFMSGWVPYHSLFQRISGDKPLESVVLHFGPSLTPVQAVQATERHLMREHGRKDFFVQADNQLAEAMKKTSDSMSLLITAIAAISLLVGGVGVMNIMLVSVTERMHEIGIRLSVGARPRDIMNQFLIEAVMICLSGGLIGVAGAWLTGAVFRVITDEFRMVFTLAPIVMACGFSALIGVMFGYFPARRAARLHPTQALVRE